MKKPVKTKDTEIAIGYKGNWKTIEFLKSASLLELFFRDWRKQILFSINHFRLYY